MLVRKSRLKVAETRLKTAEDYARQLNEEILVHKGHIQSLQKENAKIEKTMDNLRVVAGGKFDFTHKDLKPGMEVFHQTDVQSRFIMKNGKGKYELLWQKDGGWPSTAMEEVNSLQDVAKYMRKSNYFIKKDK